MFYYSIEWKNIDVERIKELDALYTKLKNNIIKPSYIIWTWIKNARQEAFAYLYKEKMKALNIYNVLPF